MQQIQILDCTLRDGGYCNQWEFGNRNILKIAEGLRDAEIDIVECGFLTDKALWNPDSSRYNSLEQAAAMLPEKRTDTMYVCMMNYGEYDIGQLQDFDGASIDGIRVAFHKKNAESAIALCHTLKEKGYKVFVQPMVSLGYTDAEFLKLIHDCNQLKPYAFYIVDSFGVMKRKELMRLFYIVEHSMTPSIRIGYHSHNNMQLAYANAQALVDMRTNRDLIIDCSILGMGRGAGNLNTELFIEHMNDCIGKVYKIKPLLNIIDEVLTPFYEKSYWGYSLPNYLSAKHNAHPNYAGYLQAKHTLTIDDMDEIFSLFEDEKKAEYDMAYIEQLYTQYLGRECMNDAHQKEFLEKIREKKILLIASGRSVDEEKEKVLSIAERTDVVSIGINFEYLHHKTDYIFVSNLRRMRQLDKCDKSRTIVTSNIHTKQAYITIDYKELLNNVSSVKDNAGLMLIKYFIGLGVKELYIAGMDGYSHDGGHNFAEQQLEFVSNHETLDAMNRGISKMLHDYASQIKISYVTKPRYLNFDQT